MWIALLYQARLRATCKLLGLLGSFTMTKPQFSKLLATCLVVLLSGCVTTQGPTGAAQPNIFQVLSDFDPFNSTGREFRELVEASKFPEAFDYFYVHLNDHFRKKYIVEKQPTPKELVALGEWHYARQNGQKISDTTKILRGITVVGIPTTWASTNALLRDASQMAGWVQDSEILTASGVGSEAVKTLLSESERVSKLFSNGRSAAFAATFGDVIESGVVPSEYPGKVFEPDEYVQSEPFQNLLEATMNNISSETERAVIGTRLARFMAPDTRKKLVDDFNVKKAKERLLADGRIDLDELGEVQKLVKEYGSASGLDGAVKVGYVDLTATSFRDRNVFDFEISFAQDYEIALDDAKELILETGTLGNYDYIFVTDLSAAKIYREFKDKREETSKTETGKRQEPNPQYVTAMTEYQQALAQMQKAKMESAIQGSRPCYGNAWACALGAVLRGASEGISESTVNEKSAQLASTPQTLSKPVYTQYQYQLVDISASKVTRVDYYVIDVKKKEVLSTYFEVKDQEKFTVSYNVEENDPDRSSILKNNQKEEDVTAWEKKPITIKLSELFDPKNLANAETKPFTTVEAFLKPLATRKYASATPVYGHGNDSKASNNNVDAKSDSSGSGTIADERFDSVVIVKNAKAIGAGFYVTPDLILTAYHVVEKGNLVELTFYDGTKTYGKVVDHDVRLDLALVKAQTAGKPVTIHTGSIRLGETVEAIGHPKGYEFTITRGVVSAIRKQSSAGIKSKALVEFVQTDTPISPGNSGGPLFLKNSVIGVNDWVRVDKASQNLNFSVSFNEIRAYLNRFEGKPK